MVSLHQKKKKKNWTWEAPHLMNRRRSMFIGEALEWITQALDLLLSPFRCH